MARRHVCRRESTSSFDGCIRPEIDEQRGHRGVATLGGQVKRRQPEYLQPPLSGTPHNHTHSQPTPVACQASTYILSIHAGMCSAKEFHHSWVVAGNGFMDGGPKGDTLCGQHQ